MSDQNKEKGFTFIELVATLLVMAIIFLVVLSRGTSTAEAEIRARAEALKSHIRLAQIRAMNMTASVSGCEAPFGMQMSGGSYYMFRDCNTGNRVVLPGAESNSISLPTDMTVSNATFSFDTWGRPYDIENPDPSTRASSTIPLTISYKGLTEQINITQNTGFVP